VREIDDLPATVWWGVQVRQSSLHTCTVHCTRAGILCSSALRNEDVRGSGCIDLAPALLGGE
jgi:hypothetical protein